MAIVDGKAILVTGGGGGIGRAHALALAAEGARVVVNDLGSDVRGSGSSQSAADGVVREIVEHGGTAVASYEDISLWDGAKRAVDGAVQSFGRLDGVLNNAGNLRKGDLADLTEEDFDSIVRVHLKGAFACTSHACAYWRDRHTAGDLAGGAVVNTISDALLVSLPGYAIYGAVKGGVAHLTTAGSREASAYNVRINAYGPRALTRMSNMAYTNPGAVQTDKPHPKDPSNSSPLVVWLLSDKSSHVTGQVFQTIGGGIARCTPWRPEEVIWPPGGSMRFEIDEIGPLVNSRIFGSRFPDLALKEPPGWNADF